jgi:hypothetical protein
MGLTLLILLAAFGAGRLVGGPPGRLRTYRFSGAPLVVAAFAVQALEPLVSRVVAYSYPLALAVSATLMVQFTLRNARVPGVPLAGLGLLLNALVVVTNGAMPVSEQAALRAGLTVESLHLDEDPRHEALDGGTRLRALGDVVPVPIPLHREVDSVGDIALASGLGLLVFSTLTRRRGVFTDEPGMMRPWVPDRC